MTKEEIIKNLKYTMEKHKNDNVPTFGTNISVMCKDILDYLEQEPILDKIRAEILGISSYKGFELGGYKDGYFNAMVNVLKILDKYKAESEGKE